MDEQLAKMVLESLTETRKDVKSLTTAVADLKAKIVGHDRCEEFRKDGMLHCREVNAKYNTRLLRVEEICFGLNAVRETTIDGQELELAKKEVLTEADEKVKGLYTRVQALEDRDRLVNLTWNLVWGNPVLKTLIASGGYGISIVAIGVYWGRIGQYGWHVVAAFLGFAFLLIISMNRDATKKAARKIMGWT